MLVERPWAALVHSNLCCITEEQTGPTTNGLAKSGMILIHLTNCYPTSKEALTSQHQATRRCERTLPSTTTTQHSTTTCRTINRFTSPGRITSRPFPPGQSKRYVLSVSVHRPASIMAHFKDRATLSRQSLRMINIGIRLRGASWNMR